MVCIFLPVLIDSEEEWDIMAGAVGTPEVCSGVPG